MRTVAEIPPVDVYVKKHVTRSGVRFWEQQEVIHVRQISNWPNSSRTAPKNLDKSEHSPLKEWCRPRLDTTAKQFCCRFAC